MSEKTSKNIFNKLSDYITKERNEKGLTDTELGKRKNKHKNNIYESVTWGVKYVIRFIVINTLNALEFSSLNSWSRKK